jgi:hypothetical protein
LYVILNSATRTPSTIHLILLDSTATSGQEHISWSFSICNFLHTMLSPPPLPSFTPLSYVQILSSLLRHLQCMIFPDGHDTKFNPLYKVTGKIIVLYILMLRYLGGVGAKDSYPELLRTFPNLITLNFMKSFKRYWRSQNILMLQ